MKNTLSIPTFLSLQSLIASAFSPTTTLQGLALSNNNNKPIRGQLSTIHAATTTSPTTDDGKVAVKTEVPVLRISVCAGELCQCQGEQYEYTGGAADAAIEELQNLGLPFPVDEVGCLGACGMGTMMAIDYENGDSIMTDGLDSTYFELGIERQPPSSVSAASEGNEDVISVSGSEEAPSVPNIVVSATSTVVEEEAPINEQKLESKKPPKLTDVRDRMRQEAAGEVGNPWMNMASYLAKKATDKMFGSK